MKRSLILSSVLILNLVAFATNSFGALITFTHTGTGTGTLGGVCFGPAAFSITGVGNTDARQSFTGGFFIDHTSASIAIAGLGTLDFVTGTRTFFNDSTNTPGFSRGSGVGGADLYNGPTTVLLDGWDMLTSVGPFAGTMNLLQWSSSPVNTSGGVLVFNSA